LVRARAGGKSGSVSDFLESSVGERIVKLEAKKEGVSFVQLSRAVAASEGGRDYYLFEYAVDSTRGRNSYISKATVRDKRLYVLTVQVKTSDFDKVEPLVESVLESFKVG
jgi:hypothetical protein